jgi:hypothetical protein
VGRVPYIAGPLSDLPAEIALEVKAFYSRLGDVFFGVMGERAFVPHEHCDPIAMAHLTSEEVDTIERSQVCKKTSLLVAVDLLPSTGMGIEVEMAYRSDVRIIILSREGKRISRLFDGNPGVIDVLRYASYDDAVTKLRSWALTHYRSRQPLFGFDSADELAVGQPLLVGFDSPDAG